MGQKLQASKITFVFGAIYVTFCVCLCLCIAALFSSPFLLSDNSPVALFPTSTVDPFCSDHACLQKCMQRLPNMAQGATLEYATGDPDQDDKVIELVRYKISEDGKSMRRIATSTVPDYLQPYQADEALHQQIWQYYATIFPSTSPLKISYLIIYTDGNNGESSARIWELGKEWRLYIDILDFDNQYTTTETLIHEFGHVLTLNYLQVKEPAWVYTKNRVGEVDWDRTRDTCKTFFFGSNCAMLNSYLDQFGKQFWQGAVYDDWFEILKARQRTRIEVAAELYQKYPDRFVTTYAATNPIEDIAETWTLFVMNEKPSGKMISEQKVRFFYEYPELVQTRTEIIQGICRYAAGLSGR